MANFSGSKISTRKVRNAPASEGGGVVSDVEDVATQRSDLVDKGLEGAGTEPDFERREQGKAVAQDGI